MTITREKVKGLLFLMVTVVCWVGSAVFIKEISTTGNYSKPLFLTYIGNGINVMFMLLLLPRCKQTTAKEVSEHSAKEYVKLTLIVSPLLFLSNYLYNLGLTLTSVSSCIILSSTSSIFVFLLSMLILKAKFSIAKCVCVVISFAGACLIGISDDYKVNSAHSLLGDVLCLISAILSANYAIQLKRCAPTDSKFRWTVFFGCFGVCVLLMGIPMAGALHVAGVEEFLWPTAATFFYLMLNGFCGSVFPDYFYARSIVLLDPLITELGVGLTVPLGMLADYIVEKSTYDTFYAVGALCVITGFVVITLRELKMKQEGEVKECMISEEKKDDVEEGVIN